MKWQTSLLLVALVAFSLPMQAEGIWFAAIMALPWASIAVNGAVSVVAGLATSGIIHIGGRLKSKKDQKKGRKLMEVYVGNDGKIDWHSGEGMAADAALHRYVHEHLAEIENHIPDPELKKETLDSSKHMPEEVEHAMVLSLEKYVEGHPQEFGGDSGPSLINLAMQPNRDDVTTTLDDHGDNVDVKVGTSGPSPAVYVGGAVAMAVSAFGGAVLIRKRQRSATHQDLETGSGPE